MSSNWVFLQPWSSKWKSVGCIIGLSNYSLCYVIVSNHLYYSNLWNWARNRMMWQEPCIIFSPHWSLRLGPVVPLLHRWHADPKSLLILEVHMLQHVTLWNYLFWFISSILLICYNTYMYYLQQGVNVEVGLLPFRPVAIKVLQCSFLSGIM